MGPVAGAGIALPRPSLPDPTRPPTGHTIRAWGAGWHLACDVEPVSTMQVVCSLALVRRCAAFPCASTAPCSVGRAPSLTTVCIHCLAQQGRVHVVLVGDWRVGAVVGQRVVLERPLCLPLGSACPFALLWGRRIKLRNGLESLMSLMPAVCPSPLRHLRGAPSSRLRLFVARRPPRVQARSLAVCRVPASLNPQRPGGGGALVAACSRSAHAPGSATLCGGLRR